MASNKRIEGGQRKNLCFEEQPLLGSSTNVLGDKLMTMEINTW